jgi:hypothetical protein
MNPTAWQIVSPFVRERSLDAGFAHEFGYHEDIQIERQILLADGATWVSETEWESAYSHSDDIAKCSDCGRVVHTDDVHTDEENGATCYKCLHAQGFLPYWRGA